MHVQRLSSVQTRAKHRAAACSEGGGEGSCAGVPRAAARVPLSAACAWRRAAGSHRRAGGRAAEPRPGRAAAAHGCLLGGCEGKGAA